jgi:uncharacterized membrane protein
VSTDVLIHTSVLLAWQRADWLLLCGALMIVVWLAIIAVMALLFVTDSGRTTTPPTSRSREVLTERHARGDTTTEEERKQLDAVP